MNDEDLPFTAADIPDYMEDDLGMYEDGGIVGWECPYCHNTYHELQEHISKVHLFPIPGFNSE